MGEERQNINFHKQLHPNSQQSISTHLLSPNISWAESSIDECIITYQNNEQCTDKTLSCTATL